MAATSLLQAQRACGLQGGSLARRGSHCWRSFSSSLRRGAPRERLASDVLRERLASLVLHAKSSRALQELLAQREEQEEDATPVGELRLRRAAQTRGGAGRGGTAPSSKSHLLLPALICGCLRPGHNRPCATPPPLSRWPQSPS